MPRAIVLIVISIIAVCALTTGRAWAHPAWGIVVDRDNQVYFSDLETIWKIDAQGKLTVFRAGVSVLANTGENGNAAITENPIGEKTEPAIETKTKVPYALIGAIAGVFALTIIIWRVRRKIVYPSA